ncbi:hypothetical protein BHM03_00057632, partial [Ensete ventricosum]
MTGVAGGFEGLVEVELGGDILADALADMEASGCHVRPDDLVLPRHPIALRCGRNGRNRGAQNPRTEEEDELQEPVRAHKTQNNSTWSRVERRNRKHTELFSGTMRRRARREGGGGRLLGRSSIFTYPGQ